MEYSIQEVARVAGTTSRTLRHYDAIRLVKPSRTGTGGYRFYDDRSLVRLQRVLLLRELGLKLDSIAHVLDAQDEEHACKTNPTQTEAKVLGSHLELLRQERTRIDRQIGAVQRTITALQHEDTERSTLMNANMFDGFDHTQYTDEVEERWGTDAYKKSDAWWRGLGETGQRAWKAQLEELNAAWVQASADGVDPHSDTAQALAARHADWLRGVPGTPTGADFTAYLTGLGDMYVADERFAANYGGAAGAAFVRDALRAYIS